jgi:hypothetical protein
LNQNYINTLIRIQDQNMDWKKDYPGLLVKNKIKVYREMNFFYNKKVHYCGTEGEYNIMIMDLLG